MYRMNAKNFIPCHSFTWSDAYTQTLAEKMCEAEWRKEDYKPIFDERLAIRHHRMTIALAMPERKR